MEVNHVRDWRKENTQQFGGACGSGANGAAPLGYGVRHRAQCLQLQRVAPKIAGIVCPGAPNRRAGILFGPDGLRSAERRSRSLGAHQDEASEGSRSSQLLNEKDDPHDREIIEELKPQPQDVVFRKRRPDGFVGTDFDLMLRSKGVKTIVIGGVATEGGVEGTARSARNLGYDMVILKDCVGSRNRELHEMALKLMEQTHFDIAAASEIAEIWGRK